MRILAALIVNKVPAFSTAGCTNDDVLQFALRDGARSGKGRYQTKIETPAQFLVRAK